MNEKSVYREKSAFVDCTVSGTRYTLYECPTQCRAIVPLVIVTNANGNVTVVLEIYKAAENFYYYVLGNKSLSTGDYVQLSDVYFVLEPGDRITVTATGTTPRVDALCTVKEMFRPLG
jgi:hypothetical protein